MIKAMSREVPPVETEEPIALMQTPLIGFEREIVGPMKEMRITALQQITSAFDLWSSYVHNLFVRGINMLLNVRICQPI